jgi:dihydrofolate reductase
VLSFVSLDGVMQAPGGPVEDTAGGFTQGGWSVGYWDDTLAQTMGEQMGGRYELLLGRRTYDIFAAAWPQIDASSPINSVRKYVATHRALPAETDVWKNSVALGDDVAGAVRHLKADEGPDLQVHGSSELIQVLLDADLVDELWLKIYPVTLGAGKRLFGPGARAAGWAVAETKTAPSGVIVANYRRAGAVKTGSFAP